jgi:hypothetical protein
LIVIVVQLFARRDPSYALQVRGHVVEVAVADLVADAVDDSVSEDLQTGMQESEVQP